MNNSTNNTRKRKPRTAQEIAERNYNLTRLLDIAIFEKRLPSKAECFTFVEQSSKRPDVLNYVTVAEQDILFTAVAKMQVAAIRTFNI